jgi:hypothetical protein
MRKLSVALIAVAVLVAAGGATAAGRYIITNIHQIKPSVVAHLKGRRGPTGPRGSKGQTGAAGQQGTPGLTAIKTYVGSLTDATPCCATTAAILATVNCPTGLTAVSGGWEADPNNVPLAAAFIDNGPSNTNGWVVAMVNEDQQNAAGIQAIVNCALGAPGATAAAARASGSRSLSIGAAHALVQRAISQHARAVSR